MSIQKTIAGWVLLAAVSLSFGVTWQKESVEFQFPGVGVRPHREIRVNDFNLTSRYDCARNVLVFSYSFPGNAKEAALNIYTLSGSLVKSVKLIGTARSVSWQVGSEGAAIGTYAVSLKCGAIEKNLRIALVR